MGRCDRQFKRSIASRGRDYAKHRYDNGPRKIQRAKDQAAHCSTAVAYDTDHSDTEYLKPQHIHTEHIHTERIHTEQCQARYLSQKQGPGGANPRRPHGYVARLLSRYEICPRSD